MLSPTAEAPAATATAQAIPPAAATETPKGAVAAATAPAGLPLAQFNSADFAGSANCALCHSRLVDAAEKDVSMDAHWRSAMMANAARDPVWQAKVSSEVTRRPELQEVIEDKCATCHMPMAHTQAAEAEEPTIISGDGFLNTDHPLHQAAMDGVSCTLCHQITDQSLGDAETFSGHYPLDLSTTPPEWIAYGPYPDPRPVPMAPMSGFTPVEGRQVQDSGLCGTCHTLFTPILDESGHPVGEFPEQTIYLEWEHSAYGDGQGSDDRSCQHCHMPVATGGVVISNTPAGNVIQEREPFYQHYFVGGNVTMLRIHQQNVEELQLTASGELLRATEQRTLEQLQSKAAELSIADAAIESGRLGLELDVLNLAGHKLPSGYPSRQVWLHITVTDGNGRVAFESGRAIDSGRIAGNDADENPAAFEPHYELITKADQVQIYEAVMANGNGQVTHTLLSAVSYAKDNRLLPQGFDAGSAGEEFAVHGVAATDVDFAAGGDHLRVEVDVQGLAAPFTVSAELLYQPLSNRFVEDLRGDSTDPVARFADYYDQADTSPVIMAAAQWSSGG
jgi:hypothetical protein